MAEFYLPPSPRWLAFRNRPEEAIRTWERLGVSPSDRGEIVPDDLRTEHDIPSHTSIPLKVRFQREINNVKLVFTSEGRNPMFLGVFLMSMQQLSGIDGVLYVSVKFTGYFP